MQSEQKNKQTELMDIKVDETLYRQAQQVASWYGLTIDQAIYYCFRAILALPDRRSITVSGQFLPCPTGDLLLFPGNSCPARVRTHCVSDGTARRIPGRSG